MDEGSDVGKQEAVRAASSAFEVENPFGSVESTYIDEVEELMNFVKEGGLALLDALYQLTLNPSPRSVGYALEANLERIRGNLVARYGKSEGVYKAIELLNSLLDRYTYERLISCTKSLLTEGFLNLLKEEAAKRFRELASELKASLSALTLLAKGKAIAISTTCGDRAVVQEESFLGPFCAMCDALGVECRVHTAEMLAVRAGLASKLVRETGSCRDVVLVFHEYAMEIVSSHLASISLPNVESVEAYLRELYRREGYRYIVRLLASFAWSDADYLKVEEDILATLLERLKPLIGFSRGYIAAPLPAAKSILRKALCSMLSETFHAIEETVEEEGRRFVAPLAELKVVGREELLAEYEVLEVERGKVVKRRIVVLPAIVQKERWKDFGTIFVSLLDTPPSAFCKLREGQIAVPLGGRVPALVALQPEQEADELASRLVKALTEKLQPEAQRERR